MPLVKTTPFIYLPALLLLGACSSIERGVVVSKGHRFRPGATPPTDYYWVDVRGRNRDGKRITERIELFRRDWNRFDNGDRISPHDYDVVGAAKKIRASMEKLARGGSAPKPKPAKADRPAARRKSPPPANVPRAQPVPETEADRAARFRSVEARARDDAAVRTLKLKIHDAKTDDEQSAAWQEYRRALFQKMRDLEPSLKDRIDAAESAPGSR